MKRIGTRLFAVLVFFAAMFGQANAVVIISYSDIGSDLVFNYSGSLNTAIAAGSSFSTQYATIGIQSSSDPTFYSASSGYRETLSVNYLGPNNPGLFATNAPSFMNVMPGSSSSGTSFMVRLNNATSGSGTTSVDLYGNWGAANAPIVGVLTIANHGDGQRLHHPDRRGRYHLSASCGGSARTRCG